MAESVRDTLNAAMTALSGDSGAAPAPEPVEAAPAPEAPAPVEAAAPEAKAAETPAKAPETTSGQERGPDGKFLPKGQAEEGAVAAPPPAPQPTESAQPENKEPQTTEAIRVPPSLPAAVKAKFASLDPDVQNAFVKLEDSVQTAKAEWDKKGQRLNRYDEILGPHLDKWRFNGLDEFSGIQTLLAAQKILEDNPVSGIVQIARSYGLTPAHLAQAFGLSQTSGQPQGAEGFQAPTGAPDIQAVLQQHLSPVLQQVQTLQQQLQQTQQRSEAEKLAETQREVEAFRSKPENMYFDNVKDDIVAMLESGRAQTLQEAYDRACWANPEIRPLLLDAQSKQAQAAAQATQVEAAKKAEAAARAKAQSASHAAGSVTGAPAPGAQAPSGPPGSVRDTLKAAMQELGAI